MTDKTATAMTGESGQATAEAIANAAREYREAARALMRIHTSTEGVPRGKYQLVRTQLAIAHETASAALDKALAAAVPETPASVLRLALRNIQHATAPTPDDGGYHEAAYDLATAALEGEVLEAPVLQDGIAEGQAA